MSQKSLRRLLIFEREREEKKKKGKDIRNEEWYGYYYDKYELEIEGYALELTWYYCVKGNVCVLMFQNVFLKLLSIFIRSTFGNENINNIHVIILKTALNDESSDDFKQ